MDTLLAAITFDPSNDRTASVRLSQSDALINSLGEIKGFLKDINSNITDSRELIIDSVDRLPDKLLIASGIEGTGSSAAIMEGETGWEKIFEYALKIKDFGEFINWISHKFPKLIDKMMGEGGYKTLTKAARELGEAASIPVILDGLGSLINAAIFNPFTSALGSAILATMAFFVPAFGFADFLGKVTGVEAEPVPLYYDLIPQEDGSKKFGPVYATQFDKLDPIENFKSGRFYQWLTGSKSNAVTNAPENSSSGGYLGGIMAIKGVAMMTKMMESGSVLNREGDFSDSGAFWEQQPTTASIQTQGDTIYQITMNNSFAVDREETADYCIGELYRRMRAEMDGARLGVAQ